MLWIVREPVKGRSFLRRTRLFRCREAIVLGLSLLAALEACSLENWGGQFFEEDKSETDNYQLDTT